MAVTAQGMAKAAELLVRQFTLIVTNVPYLGAWEAGFYSQGLLRSISFRIESRSRSVLRSARCIGFCSRGGSVALVTPQSWLFLGAYLDLRKHLLCSEKWGGS